jgi:lipopolysaccharide export system protein LptA
MDQPGRHGTGDQLLYNVAAGSYVLTGTPTLPPHIIDTQQGNVTGATLVFSDAGSTIVVSGDPKGDSNAPRSKGTRVRTETHVSPATEERQ